MDEELDQFLKDYETTTNTHDFDNVAPLLDEEAVYWFSDGSYEGIQSIRQAFIDTWDKIKDEVYQIKNVRWVDKEENLAVCIYEFHWEGIVDGERLSGIGRGTNVIRKIDGKWKMLHEHLSKVV